MTLALSHKNGIDFFVRNRKMVIHMTKDSDGEIKMEKYNGTRKVKKIELGNPLKLILVPIIIFLATVFKGMDTNSTILLAIVGLFVFPTLSVLFDYKYPPMQSRSRFHAAEHKAFNYLEEYRRPPKSIEDLSKMSSITKECGTSTKVLNTALAFLFAFGIMYIPTIPFKMFWCLVSLLIVYYLWDTDKLNFVQKLTIAEPTESELLLALIGITEYWKMKEGVDYKSDSKDLE